MIREADSQIDRYEDKIALLNENIAKNMEIDPNFMGSSEYFALEDSIKDCESSIRSARKQQAEWNEEIKQLPVKRAEQYVTMLQNVAERYNNFMSQLETDGKDVKLEHLQQGFEIQEKIVQGYEKEITELKKVLRTYDKGSEKWEELSNQIASAESGIASAVQSMQELNQQILEMPLKQLEKLTTKLDNIKTALDEIVEDEGNAASAAQAVIDRRIKDLQKENEELQKHYENDLIDPLREQLELLQKQNEARQRQLALEKAQYDLDKAREQKSVQLEKNGELVWAADEEAVKNAQDALEDARFAKMIGDLQDQLDAYNKVLDDANKKLEKQVDILEKAAEEWASIHEDAEYLINIQDAVETLKKFDPNINEQSFEDGALQGKDAKFFDPLKKSYESNTQKSQELQKQLDQTGHVSTLVERLNSLVTNGTMTSREANSIMQNIKNAAQDGFMSNELLQQTLAVEQMSNVRDAITSAQTHMDGIYSQFTQSMNTMSANTKVIADHTNTWEEIKKNTETQISSLKSIRSKLDDIEDSIGETDHFEEFEKELEKESRNSSSKSSSTFVYEYGSNAKSGSRPKGGDTVKYRDSSGNVSDMIIGKPARYAKGIENGPVQANDTLRTNILKRLATVKLNKSEVPVIADIGEVILNPNQQEQVLENFRNAVMNSTKLVPVGVSGKSQETVVNVSLGDIRMEGVQDPDGFAKALVQNFEPVMSQNFSKVFNR